MVDDPYIFESMPCGALLTRTSDGATVYFQPGDDAAQAARYFDSVGARNMGDIYADVFQTVASDEAADVKAAAQDQSAIADEGPDGPPDE